MSPRLATLLALAATLCPIQPRIAGAAAPPAARTDCYRDPLPPGAVARLGATRFRPPFSYCVAWSRDGKSLVSGGEGGHVYVWDSRTGREVRRFGGHGLGVTCIAFSPDGRLLATRAHPEDIIRLWDFAAG